MRYDSEEHLQAWRLNHVYPKIHDTLFNFIRKTTSPTGFCDLCCSTGLLGQRLLEAGYTGFGVDCDADAIGRARAAGVKLFIVQGLIIRVGLPNLRRSLEGLNTEIVIARRCLPEILEKDNFGAELGATLRAAGVNHVFLQGRKTTPRPKNPFHTLQLEVAALHGWRYTQDFFTAPDDCAHLVPV